MRVWWFISIVVCLFRPSYTWWWGKYIYPAMEEYHYPGAYTSTMSPYVNGTAVQISDPNDTPDYRIEEPLFTIKYYEAFIEMERPYRNSPNFKQAAKTGGYWRDTNIPKDFTKGDTMGGLIAKSDLLQTTFQITIENQMGCYCNTVYRKFTLLSGCAVITTRHIITTATPTALILRSYSHLKVLEGILGGWYDVDANVFNSSIYMSPSRIHMHPFYKYDYEVNVSHPIPAMYDLCVWAATAPFYGSFWSYNKVIICPRAASGWYEYSSTIPRYNDVSVVAGFMFIKSYKRRPLPWFRYIVKTQSHVWPCPKSDWHWYHCIMGEYWGKYGFDSGGGMNTGYKRESWRTDGMAGICAFSMKLRSKQTVHYFTVVDTWPVLDWLYDAFLGLKKGVFLDDRFEDTKWAAPRPYWGEYIDYGHVFGFEVYYETGDVPKYRR